MTQPTKITQNTDPVSTITKHIKIYSDNPIHDAIDRIIDSCSALDEGGDSSFLHACSLQAVAAQLLLLASEISQKEIAKYIGDTLDEKPN